MVEISLMCLESIFLYKNKNFFTYLKKKKIKDKNVAVVRVFLRNCESILSDQSALQIW